MLPRHYRVIRPGTRNEKASGVLCIGRSRPTPSSQACPIHSPGHSSRFRLLPLVKLMQSILHSLVHTTEAPVAPVSNNIVFSLKSASYTMKRTLLISGQRANFTTLSLDIDKRELNILADYPGPFNVSWVEPSSSHGDVDRLIGLSEGDDSGLLYTFQIDHAQKTCNITSQKPTLGAPAHCM